MRILHTMIRVEDLERSIEFYQSVLGMRVLKRKDFPTNQFTLCFMGYQDIADGHVLELTYNWDKRSYEMGNAYGHIAIAVDDLYQACERVKAAGGKITREPGPMKDSNPSRLYRRSRWL